MPPKASRPAAQPKSKQQNQPKKDRRRAPSKPSSRPSDAAPVHLFNPELLLPDREMSPLVRVLNSSAPANTNTQELLTEYTFYMDLYFGRDSASVIADPVQNIWFQLNRNVSSSLSTDSALGRVDQTRVYVLPNTNIGAGTPGYDDPQVDASYLFVAACPAAAPTGSTTTFPAANTKTLILPSLAPTWKKVLDWKASKVFDAANLEPKISSAATMGPSQAIAMFGAFDSSSGDPFARTVQVMIKVKFRVPLGVRNSIDIGKVPTADFQGNLSAPSAEQIFQVPTQLVISGVSDMI